MGYEQRLLITSITVLVKRRKHVQVSHPKLACHYLFQCLSSPLGNLAWQIEIKSMNSQIASLTIAVIWVKRNEIRLESHMGSWENLLWYDNKKQINIQFETQSI